MSRARSSLLLAFSLLAGCSGGGSTGAPSLLPQTATTTQSVAASTGSALGLESRRNPFAGKFKHVIIVIMENRTFDNVFNGFPGADTAQFGRTHDGKTVALGERPYYGLCDPDHSHAAWEKDYDGGKMDGFDTTPASCIGITPSPTYPYGYLPHLAVRPYWDLASEFTVADRMFASQSGPSYPGHLYLVAGQSHNETDDPNALEWGCDAPAGTTVPTLDSHGKVNGSEFPCLTIPTLATRIDQRNLTWKYYTNQADYRITGKKTELSTDPFDAISQVRNGPEWNADMRSPIPLVYSDIMNGNLPTLAWVNPPLIASDHPQDTTNFGPDFVASLANTLAHSPYWNDTALFVTWDDHGGWYDHVAPPQLDGNGLGFRVPLIIVSKYARRHYVSHVQHEFGSILKFTEEALGLDSLGATDMRADDLRDAFDFQNTPPAYKPIVQLSVGVDFFLHIQPDTDALDQE